MAGLDRTESRKAERGATTPETHRVTLENGSVLIRWRHGQRMHVRKPSKARERSIHNDQRKQCPFPQAG